jgi:hypothetical protein
LSDFFTCLPYLTSKRWPYAPVQLLLEKGKDKENPSASQLPHKSQELEIHDEKHFEGFHKESFIRWIFSKELFSRTE